jgi:DNA polymerase III epsilon subunit-like protein
MLQEQLLFLDTETTGTGPHDRLCQVAYSIGEREVEALFKPPVPISIEAMSVTHITNRMVERCEAFVGSAMQRELTTLLAEGAILVAHNAKFDIEMLRREGLIAGPFIDTFKLSHYLDAAGVVSRHNLQYLRYYHDLVVDNVSAHDALGDVRVLRALFDFYFSTILEKTGSETVVLREMLEVSARPILMKKFPFGKYAGKEVKQVAVEDPGYLVWMLNQKIMTREQGGEDDEHWIYTLDYYLPKP